MRVLPIILILTAFVLVACGGGDDDSAEATELVFPTEMVITTETEEAIGNPLPEETAEDVPPIADTIEPVIEETPPVGNPDDSQNPVPEVTEFVPPTSSVDDVPIQSEPDGGEVITDFSQLTGSVVGIFAGTLSVVMDDETGQPNISLSDADGNVLEVLIPPIFVDGLDNTAVELQGVASASVENPEVFVLRASTVFVDGVEQSGAPVGEGGLPEGVDAVVTTVAPVGPPISGAEVLDVQLDADLSALQAYDALIEVVAESITGHEWFVLSGNLELGWTLEFIDVETNSTQLYTVLPDGSVQVIASGNFVPPGTEVYLLDRDLIVVDSTDLLVVDSEDTGGPPLGTPVLILQGGVEGQMIWTIQNSTAEPIDATVVQEE